MLVSSGKRRPVLCVILDGWGYRPEKKHNAIAASRKPIFDWLWGGYPHSLLQASGEAVGLPEGQIGNSEIGHMTIGAGRPIDTDLVRISKAAKHGEFGDNTAFQSVISHVKANDGTLHVLGILSRGGVHGHEDHYFELVKMAASKGVKKISLHPFLDGRDTLPQIGAESLARLESLIAGLGVGRIASVSGRYYAMDRDKNWARTECAERAICDGYSDNLVSGSASRLLTGLYKEGALDELLPPHVFKVSNAVGTKIQNGDGIIFTNFRADRARQLMIKLLERAKDGNIKIATFTRYEPTFTALVAFDEQKILTTLGKEISRSGKTQAHIAETEKFPHVTYFVNGGVEKPFENERHVVIESRKDIKTHDEAPLMRAREIADAAIKEIEDGTDFIFVNFANPDMVGHTGNVPRIIEGVEAVDKELSRVIEALHRRGGIALVTADHGNAELNIDPETGSVHTAHTVNPVPVFITMNNVRLREGALYDVAPTLLELMGLDMGEGMTGQSLLIQTAG